MLGPRMYSQRRFFLLGGSATMPEYSMDILASYVFSFISNRQVIFVVGVLYSVALRILY